MNDVILKMLVVVFFIAMIAINYLANSLPFNNKSTGDISSQYSNYFTPTGFTFSIWGIIYIMVGVFVVRLALQNGVFFEQVYVTRLILFFVFSCIFNMLWLTMWHYNKIELSMVMMIGLLISLIFVGMSIPDTEVFMKATFSVYTGWISVATIANATILLVKWNIPFFQNNQIVWYLIVVTIGLILAGMMLFGGRDVLFGIVFIWAYFGIIMKHIYHEEPYFKTTGPTYYTSFLFFVIIIMSVYIFIQNGAQLYHF